MKHRHDSTFRILPFLSGRDDEVQGDIPDIEEDRPLKQLLGHWQAPGSSDALDERVLGSYRNRHLRGWRAAGHLVGGWRKVFVCAVAATLLAVATTYWFAHDALHASVLLDQTRASEARIEASQDDAAHRVLRFEERRRPENTVVVRRRVEIWQSGARGIKARRLFDDRNTLVAGEWATESGPVNVYWAQSGTRPATLNGAAPVPNRSLHEKASLAAEHMWRWEPAANEFQRAIGGGVPQLQQDADSYVLSYRRSRAADSDTPDPVLLEATLTISKRDLRSVQQSFVVRTGRSIREYRFTELAYERLNESDVSPAVFEPEAVLRPPAVNTAIPPVRVVPPPRVPRPASPDRALQRLEMETAYALHRLNACVEEGQSVLTVEDGRVRVTTTTDRELRRALLIQGLSRVAMNEGVELDIQLRAANTSLESESQSARPGSRSALEIRMREHLRARMGHQAGGDAAASAIDAAARDFTHWVLERAEARVHQAQALKALAVRWSPGSLHERELDVVATWQQMVRDHARQLEQETEVLRLQLEPLYSAIVPESTAATTSRSVADIRDVPLIADRLVMLTSHQYAVLQAALELDTGTNTASPLNDSAWWSGLRAVQNLASAFAGPWSLGPDLQRLPSGETR